MQGFYGLAILLLEKKNEPIIYLMLLKRDKQTDNEKMFFI